MKSLYLLPFILVLATANIAVDISNSNLRSSGYLYCLKCQGATKILLNIWDGAGNLNRNFRENYMRAKGLGINDFDAIITLNDTFPAEEICNEAYIRVIPGGFKGTVWLGIQNEAGLWSRDVAQRIPWIEKVAKTCQNLGLKTGIYSDLYSWARVTGYQWVGTNTLKALPVWYSNGNLKQNFDDFIGDAGFGTWETPAIKLYEGSPIFCGERVRSLSYYESSTLMSA